MKYIEPRHNKRKFIRGAMQVDYKKLNWVEKLLIFLGIVLVFLMFLGVTK